MSSKEKIKLLTKNLFYKFDSKIKETEKKKLIGKWARDIDEEIRNKSFFEILKFKIDQEEFKNKGKIGNIVEFHLFGVSPNNRSEADLEKIGVEIKTTPMKKNENQILKPKERLVFSKISFVKIIKQQDFLKSDFFKKNSFLLILFYEYDFKKQISDYSILKTSFFSLLDLEDIKQIIKDYNFIVNKIISGQAHLISSSDTEILEACTKAANSEVLEIQPKNYIKAKPRAFAFKRSFISKLYYSSNNVIFNQHFNTIEDIKNKIENYKNWNVSDLRKKFNYYSVKKNNKFFLIKKILGIKDFEELKPLIDSDVIIKNVVLENDFSLKEHIPLYKIIVEELNIDKKFENSSFYEYLKINKILFIIFQKDYKKNDEVLLKTFLFEFSNDEYLLAKEVFEDTQKKYNYGGAIFKGIKRDKYNFIKPSDEKIFHIRPGAINKHSRYNTQFGESIVKQKFWLNKEYFLKKIK